MDTFFLLHVVGLSEKDSASRLAVSVLNLGQPNILENVNCILFIFGLTERDGGAGGGGGMGGGVYSQIYHKTSILCLTNAIYS